MSTKNLFQNYWQGFLYYTYQFCTSVGNMVIFRLGYFTIRNLSKQTLSSKLVVSKVTKNHKKIGGNRTSIFEKLFGQFFITVNNKSKVLKL